VPVGFWRSVGHCTTLFGRLIDELAHAAGDDLSRFASRC
jgi:hypothetical protein